VIEGSSVAAATADALATPEWIGTAEKLVIAGPPGTVKSHLAEALRSCDPGWSSPGAPELVAGAGVAVPGQQEDQSSLGIMAADLLPPLQLARGIRSAAANQATASA
jgi:hypothetical protein